MNKKLIIVAGLVVAVGAALLWFFNTGEPVLVKNNPWKPAKVSYNSDCGPQCAEKVSLLPRASGSHIPNLLILQRPDLDDAYTQLADCLQSVMQCVTTTGGPKQTSACVTKSICPQPCKDAYGTITKGVETSGKLLDAVEKVFLSDQAHCSPKRWETVQ